MLLPRISQDKCISWGIWTLSTWLESYDDFPENINLLRIPSPTIDINDRILTDVLIIGGGNAYVIESAFHCQD
jgi:hypothetical protein